MRGILAVSLVVVSLVLDGCGGCGDDGGGRLPDAPPLIDAAADAPDAMLQPVTLTVTNLGQPAAGVRVYFVNADDTLVSAVDTDSYGVASAVMVAGGSVTAINPFAPLPVTPTGKGTIDDELRTFVGVKPGDHLVLNRSEEDSVTFNVDFDTVDGGDEYVLYTTCGVRSITPVIEPQAAASEVFLENCHGAADVAILVSDVQSDVTVPIKGLYHPDATLMSDQTLDLTGDTYQDLTTVTFTYPNSPDRLISVLHAPIAKNGAIGPFATELSGGTGSPSAASAGTASIEEPTLTGVTKAAVASSLVVNSQHDILEWGAFTTAYTLDFTNLLLREITGELTLDIATSKLSWIEAEVGAVPDFTVAAVTVQRIEPSQRQWHWELAAPRGGSEIKLPSLPTDVFDWKPVEGDQVVTDPVTNAKVTGGYDAVRARIFDVVDRGSLTSFVTGETGRVVSVQWRPPVDPGVRAQRWRLRPGATSPSR